MISRKWGKGRSKASAKRRAERRALVINFVSTKTGELLIEGMGRLRFNTGRPYLCGDDTLRWISR